jgi:hypothetical protein
MSYDPIDNELIERYMLGKLSEAEIRSFEERRENDREFRRKCTLIKTFPEMMSEQARHEYEKNRIEEEAKIIVEKPKRLPKRSYLIWAGIILILLIFGVILFMVKGTDNQSANTGQQVQPAVPETKIVQPVIRNNDTVKAKDTSAIKPVQQPDKKETVLSSLSSTKPISLLNPTDGLNVTKKEMITFNWIQKTDSFTRFYIVSESHNQVVYWRGVRLGVREYKVPANYFFPGKYYWYVGSKAEKRSFIVSE